MKYRFSLVLSLLLTAVVPVRANQRTLTPEKQQTVDVLNKAIAALEAFETLECDLIVYSSSPIDPSVALENLALSYAYRRVSDDPQYGIQFSGLIRDLGSDKRAGEIFDGERLVFIEMDDRKVADMPAEAIWRTYGSYYIYGWNRELRLLRDAVTFPVGEFREMHANPLTVGEVLLDGDTVIQGRPCWKIVNTRVDNSEDSERWMRTDQIVAVDQGSHLPVYQWMRFQYVSKGTPQADQEMRVLVTDFTTGGRLDDDRFRIPEPEDEDSGESGSSAPLRWEGGRDVTGRWDADFNAQTMQGKVVVVNFGYTGDRFCDEGVVIFDSLARTYAGDERVQFLYMNPLDTPDTIAGYAESKGLSIPVLSIGWDIPNEWAVESYPCFMVIGPDGRPAWRMDGFPTHGWLGGQIAMYIDQELKKLDR